MGPLPHICTEVPGPKSLALAQRLRRVECRNITYLAGDWPVFWEAAAGANVQDVDGNVYLDLTSAFAVASVGHSNPAVAAAAAEQSTKLIHGMGDVHPTELKVTLAEKIAELMPGDLHVSIFSGSGCEAVESALKTAILHSGKPGVIAFDGAYHGLGPGALDATARAAFRRPFAPMLSKQTVHLPFPAVEAKVDHATPSADDVLRRIEHLVSHPDAAGDGIGAVLLEPIQGRGGVRIPQPGFLRGLRRICDEHRLTLIADEIFTGFGRTGRWFACEHEGVVPDLMCVGKALGGGFPISACVGRPSVMDAWPVSEGEALHTSTFLGSPLGCAMALAAIREMEQRDLPGRSAELGDWFLERLQPWRRRFDCVQDVRGRGMMIGIELSPRGPAGGKLAFAISKAALARGLLILPGGSFGNVISLSPPLTVTREQLEAAATIMEECLTTVAC